jgi:predicted transcriptional regulator
MSWGNIVKDEKNKRLPLPRRLDTTIGDENKRRRFNRRSRKQQIDKYLQSMRQVNDIIELAATLGKEEKNKVAKELESTIENIKRGLDRLK